MKYPTVVVRTFERFLKPLISYVMLRWIGRLNWTGVKYFFTNREYDLTDEDIGQVARILKQTKVIGLGYRETHFTSYPILLIYYCLTGKLRGWSHAWLSCRPSVTDGLDIRIYESVAEGVRSAPFWKVLCVDAVALLVPKYFHPDLWDELDLAVGMDVGKVKYDVLANIKNQTEVNCIEEVVFRMLSVDPNCLPGTVALMKQYNQLTPQMIYDSGDFEILLEIRR